MAIADSPLIPSLLLLLVLSQLHSHYNGAGDVHPGLRHAVLVSTSSDPFLLLERSMAIVKSRIRHHWSHAMKERLQELTAHAAQIPAPSFPRGPGAAHMAPLRQAPSSTPFDDSLLYYVMP